MPRTLTESFAVVRTGAPAHRRIRLSCMPRESENDFFSCVLDFGQNAQCEQHDRLNTVLYNILLITYR